MLRGSITALLTPFANGALDEKAFERFVEWQDTNVQDTCPAAVATRLLWCAQDLRRTGKGARLLTLLSTKIPFLAAHYGPGDPEVRSLALFAAEAMRCANRDCPTPFVDDTLVCGRCKVARYCGRECQRAHWASGHKEKCVQDTETKKR